MLGTPGNTIFSPQNMESCMLKYKDHFTFEYICAFTVFHSKHILGGKVLLRYK